VKVLGSFTLSLSLSIGLGFLEFLFPFRLVAGGTCLVLLVDLLVLGELLLELR
jgi:hypothetical protein